VAEPLTIATRFHGPPASGHGGYTAGIVARALGHSPVAVTLRSPPPLETPLAVQPRHVGIALLDGETVVATADPADVAVEAPAMPQPTTPEPDDPVYGELHEHPFPGCFACGPAREPGDGLRIFASRVPGRDGMVAAWWEPDASLAAPGGDGEIASEFVWSALDCPTGHACAIERPAVLARLAMQQFAPVHVGERYVVAGWRMERDGRKHRAAGCLYAPDGTPLAVSDALWIELRDPAALGAV
jgi:hypothetical protein